MFNFTNDTQTQSANTRTFQKLFLKVTKIFQNITFFLHYFICYHDFKWFRCQKLI